MSEIDDRLKKLLSFKWMTDYINNYSSESIEKLFNKIFSFAFDKIDNSEYYTNPLYFELLLQLSEFYYFKNIDPMEKKVLIDRLIDTYELAINEMKSKDFIDIDLNSKHILISCFGIAGNINCVDYIFFIARDWKKYSIELKIKALYTIRNCIENLSDDLLFAEQPQSQVNFSREEVLDWDKLINYIKQNRCPFNNIIWPLLSEQLKSQINNSNLDDSEDNIIKDTIISEFNNIISRTFLYRDKELFDIFIDFIDNTGMKSLIDDIKQKKLFLFNEHSIVNWGNLTQSLRKKNTKEKQLLWELISLNAKQSIENCIKNKTIDEKLKQEIIYSFNKLIKTSDLHEQDEFAKFKTDDDSIELVNKITAMSNLNENQAINRIILDYFLKDEIISSKKIIESLSIVNKHFFKALLSDRPLKLYLSKVFSNEILDFQETKTLSESSIICYLRLIDVIGILNIENKIYEHVVKIISNQKYDERLRASLLSKLYIFDSTKVEEIFKHLNKYLDESPDKENYLMKDYAISLVNKVKLSKNETIQLYNKLLKIVHDKNENTWVRKQAIAVISAYDTKDLNQMNENRIFRKIKDFLGISSKVKCNPLTDIQTIYQKCLYDESFMDSSTGGIKDYHFVLLSSIIRASNNNSLTTNSFFEEKQQHIKDSLLQYIGNMNNFSIISGSDLRYSQDLLELFWTKKSDLNDKDIDEYLVKMVSNFMNKYYLDRSSWRYPWGRELHIKAQEIYAEMKNNNSK